MKVGDRIRVFEIQDKEAPEIKGKHYAELQTKGWYGTGCPEIPFYKDGEAWAVIVGVHAKHVCTMVITKLK